MASHGSGLPPGQKFMEAFSLLLFNVGHGIYTAMNVGMKYEAVKETFPELVKVFNGVSQQIEEPTECFVRKGLLEGMAGHGVYVASGAT
ncbi:hypothetical protein ACLB2K_007089 [Fragaria x ananassa]